MRTTITACAVAIGVAGVIAQQSETQAPTFRSEVNYVQLPVRVVDDRRLFVRDLTESDFQIFEDGKPQQIAYFSFVDIRADSPQEDGRHYVLFVDDLYPDPKYTTTMTTLLRKFIVEKMSPNDRAAVVLMSGLEGQEFTSDQRALLAAVGRVRSRNTPEVRFLHERKTVEIIRLIESLESLRGRHRALVLFTQDGLCDLGEYPSYSRCDTLFREAAQAALRANVSIYTVDPRGLVVMTGAMHGWNMSTRVPPNPRREARAAFSDNTNPGLWMTGAHHLTVQTGGFMITRSNNLEQALARIVQENSAYYLIGYYSTHTAGNGRFRRHEIKVTRPDVTVLHRAGYLTPRTSARAGR